MQAKTYHFEEVETCEMCGASGDLQTTLGLRLNRSQGTRPRGLTGIAVGIRKCRHCGLVYPDPLPIPERIEDHYSVDPEAYWGDYYFEEDPQYFAPQIATAKRLLGFAPGMTALDIGAGIGKALSALQRSGFDAFGVEPSPTFRSAAIKRGIAADRLFGAPLETAEINRTFDFITFGAVLEHLYHPSVAIAKALDLLAPNGVIHIEVPSSRHAMAKLLNLYYRMRGTSYVTHISPMHPPFHIYEFTLDSFLRNGERQGYQVVEHEYHQNDVLFLPIPRLLRPALSTYMRRTDRGMQLTVWLQRRS